MKDLEIERRIADIEGVHYIETKYDKNNFLALVSENDYTGSAPEMIGKYSPLTDDGLCFRLMVKYRIKVIYEAHPDYYHTYATVPLCQEGASESNPNRAICLAIISAHKDV